MGRVRRNAITVSKDEKTAEHLKQAFGIDFVKGQAEYRGAEIEDILVDLNIEEKEEYLEVGISKLVSLKAFLLSKESGMDINELVTKIDRIMEMSEGGFDTNEEGVLYDSNLEKFFEVANMKSEGNTIDDGKRRATVEMKDGRVDFNTIEEIL